jgi:uncharacterized protein YneF (UPF0154 family)
MNILKTGMKVLVISALIIIGFYITTELNMYEYEFLDKIEALPPFFRWIAFFLDMCCIVVATLIWCSAIMFLCYGLPLAILGGIVYGIYRCHKRFSAKL